MKLSGAVSTSPVRLERQHPPVVGEGMQHDGDVLAGFDHLVEITDAAGTHRARQRSVEPLRVATFQQVAAGEIGCGEVVMAGDRPKRKPDAGSHVRHKIGFCRNLSAP